VVHPLLNIAIVEDHDALREIMVEVLRREGHHVQGLDCAEALDDSLIRSRIDLLISDLNLPGADGYSLTRRFRAAHPLAGIIMVTARNALSDKVEGYEVGTDIYLAKPVSPEELVAAVNTVARRLHAQRTQGKPQTLMSLELDSRRSLISGPLGDCTLVAAEATILTALARAPDQQLEVWQLLELLSLDLDTYSKATFEVRLARLRKKLVQVGAEKSSLRVIGRGTYQLAVTLRIY
jgi:DNA-binding response OmpR family regulator